MLEANTTILLIYACINTALLFYYINVFYAVNNFSKNIIFNFNEVVFELFANMSIFVLVLNTFAFLYFDYMSF